MALLAGVGCSKAQRELEDIEKRACGCTDAKCGEAMADELIEWANRHKDDSVSDEDGLRQSLTNAVDCMMKAGADPMSIKTRMMSLGG
ncbi:MAG: hypothetical protein AB7T06_46075 [Kofleriaceae bacterium]